MDTSTVKTGRSPGDLGALCALTFNIHKTYSLLPGKDIGVLSRAGDQIHEFMRDLGRPKTARLGEVVGSCPALSRHSAWTRWTGGD